MAATKGKRLQWDLSALVEDFGIESLVQSLGIKRVMEAVGPEKVIQEMGVDWLLSKLPPAELKKLKERLR